MKKLIFSLMTLLMAAPALAEEAAQEATLLEKGLIVAEGYDYEIIDKAYRAYDNLCLSVTLKAEGTIDKVVVASMAETLKMDPAEPDYARIREVFRCPSLKLASFTITEKGYNIKGADGAFYPAIEADFAAGPEKVQSYIGKVAAMVYARYQAGALNAPSAPLML